MVDLERSRGPRRDASRTRRLDFAGFPSNTPRCGKLKALRLAGRRFRLTAGDRRVSIPSSKIGERYGLTEQTITGWLRQGLRELRAVLGDGR